jgi:hypothetical protein
MQNIESEYLLTSRNYIDDVDHYQGIEYVDTETSEDDPFTNSNNTSSYYETRMPEDHYQHQYHQYGATHQTSMSEAETCRYYRIESCTFEDSFN